MKNILLFIYCALLYSCKELEEKTFTTEEFELRQLLNKTDISKSDSGFLFFAVGSYSSEYRQNDVVKVFAKVDGQYRMLKFDLEDIRIHIDNKRTIPAIQYQYKNINKFDNERLLNCNTYEYYDGKIIIHCPEQYLPEKLLPITLKTE